MKNKKNNNDYFYIDKTKYISKMSYLLIGSKNGVEFLKVSG